MVFLPNQATARWFEKDLADGGLEPAPLAGIVLVLPEKPGLMKCRDAGFTIYNRHNN